MSQRNNFIKEKKKETVGNANVWAPCRQAMAPTTLAVGFVLTDYPFEELGFKSYSLEDSSVRQVPQGRLESSPSGHQIGMVQ